jgi:hypothetical protein
MIASLEENIVVVRALLEGGGENNNFGLSLMPTIRGSTALIQPMHMVPIDCF